MTLSEKKKRIDELKIFIDDCLFKIDANKSLIKKKDQTSNHSIIDFQNLFYSMQIRMTYTQIEIILAIPKTSTA